MEQLAAAFGIEWDLLIAQAVNFLIVLGVLTYFLYKPALRAIDARREKIAEGIRAANEADARLAEAESEKKGIVAAAVRDAEGIVTAARERAEERAGEIVEDANLRADSILKDAGDRAEEAKRRMLAESERDITRAAMLAAEKILLARSEAGGVGGREKQA